MPANDRLYDETAPRSIFATTWFRALLVLIVLAVAVAISAPYLLDVTRSSKVASRPTVPPTAPTPSPATTSPSSTATATPSPATTVPAPGAKSTLSPPAPSPAPTSPAPSAKSTALDKPVPPDRVPVDKSAPMPPRRPLAGDTTALADKPLPGDKSSKTTSSDGVGSDKSTAKSATADTSTTEKKDARVAAATTQSKATARAAKPAAARSTTSASAPRAAAASAWWVQVGAFRDENSAKNLAAKLREQNYTVQLRGLGASAPKAAALDKSAPAASTPNPAGADQYDVFVTGLSADELNTRLAGKGLSAEPSGTGVVLKPSLPLRDAVALSKDLATDGYKVQVRRAGGASAQAPRPAEQRPVPAASSGDTLYRVRVGAFTDRTTAMTTLKELEAKGYKPFIARGGS